MTILLTKTRLFDNLPIFNEKHSWKLLFLFILHIMISFKNVKYVSSMIFVMMQLIVIILLKSSNYSK